MFATTSTYTQAMYVENLLSKGSFNIDVVLNVLFCCVQSFGHNCVYDDDDVHSLSVCWTLCCRAFMFRVWEVL